MPPFLQKEASVFGRFRKHPWRCLFAAAAVALVVFFAYRGHQVRRGDALVKRLWGATSPEERTAVREEISRLRNATAIYRVVLVLNLENPKMQADAMEGLVAIGPAAVGPLGKPLCERSRQWNEFLKSHNVTPWIRAVFVSDEDLLMRGRAHAATVLGRIGDARAVDALIKALGDSRAVEPLIEALDSPAPAGVKNAAASALGQFGDKRAVEPLIAVLRNGDGSPNGTVARALGQIGDQRAVKPLIDALYFSLNYMDMRIVNALVRIGDKDALPVLRSASDCYVGYPYIWEEVQDAIRQIEEQQPSGR